MISTKDLEKIITKSKVKCIYYEDLQSHKLYFMIKNSKDENKLRKFLSEGFPEWMNYEILCIEGSVHYWQQINDFNKSIFYKIYKFFNKNK